jgi:hypothetical protein
MTYFSENYINEMINDTNDLIVRGKFHNAYMQADQVIGLIDSGMLISETPCVIVDKARAMRDRAFLAKLYYDATCESFESDLEAAFYEG